jgi:hypothetical protein
VDGAVEAGGDISFSHRKSPCPAGQLSYHSSCCWPLPAPREEQPEPALLLASQANF